MVSHKSAPLFSVEAAAALALGLTVGLIPEMEWWLRALGVLATCALAIHTGYRIEGPFLKRLIFPFVIIIALLSGTWRSMWNGFHQDFPEVTNEAVVAKIVEFSAVAICCLAGYFFILRPRAKEGYRLLPAQVMAFGACIVAAGFVTLLVGLGWQFQQNWAAGIKPTGAPIFTVGPPQITQAAPPPALPAPQKPTTQNPLFANYNLTEDGITALTKELFKIRDALRRRIELDRMGTDGTANGFVSNFGRVCDLAGIECPVNNVHPNSPDEKGIMIYVADSNKPSEAAQELRATLLKIGLDVPFVARPGFGPDAFSLFVGPRP
jgi:hypothetical protein